MSGGYLGYYYAQNIDEHLCHLNEAIALLERLDLEDSKAFDDMEEIVELVKKAQSIKERLSDVLHAAEWHLSGDFLESDVRKEIEKYEAK